MGNSTSQIKTGGYVDTDYQVETITLSDLDKIFPFKDVGFIKVDIEGGAENILDNLYTIYTEYKIPLYIHFYYSWWNDKNLDRFLLLNSDHKNKITHEYINKIKHLLS